MALFLQSTSGSNGGVLFGQKSRLALVASNILVDGHHYNLVRTSDRVSFTSAETPKEKVFLRNNDGILAYQNGLPVRGKQMSVTIKLYLSLMTISCAAFQIIPSWKAHSPGSY